MTCPNCNGKGCKICGGDGTVPDWLADPNINKAAKDWQEKK
jgi:hypothetical protein